ncbi:MAG TPA: M14 family metallopeptidase [Fermentimonas sp.]|nr:M14 family metallopeptidase [Fermentimonas sp.]
MSTLNNIPNSGQWGDAASKLNDNFNKLNQAITTVENKSVNNKGYFPSLSVLNTAFPSPKTGQTAYVYDNATSNYIIYNAVNGLWTTQSVPAPPIGVAVNDYAKHGGSSKTLKQVDDEIVQLAGEASVLNVTNKYSLSQGEYYTLSTAIAAVSPEIRKTGLKITFQKAQDIWETYQYVGADTTVWFNESRWIAKHPVQEKGNSQELFMSQDAVAKLIDNIEYTVAPFEFGSVLLSNGSLLNRTDRIRTIPVYFNTKNKIGQTITFKYTVISGFSPNSIYAYMGSLPVKRITENYSFSNGDISFIYDGTFDNVRIIISKTVDITEAERDNHSVYKIEKPFVYWGEMPKVIDLANKTLVNEITRKGYIDIPEVGSRISYTLTPFSAFVHAIIDVNEGDEFIISSRGGFTSRAFAFIDENRNVISVAESNTTYRDYKIIASQKGRLVYNSYVNESDGVTPVDYFIKKIKKNNVETDYFNNNLLNYKYTVAPFEFGSVLLSNGSLLNRTDRIRTTPIFFNTENKIGQTITFKYTSILGFSPSSIYAYMGSLPVKRITENYSFSNGDISFAYDGTFDNVRVIIGKTTDITEIERDNHSVYEIERAIVGKDLIVRNIGGSDSYAKSFNTGNVFSKNRVYPDMGSVIATEHVSDIYDLYDELLTNNSDYITKTLLGNDESGVYPIYRYDFKPINLTLYNYNRKRLKFIICSGTHGEPVGYRSLYHTMENICNQWMDNELLSFLRFNVEFVIIPIVNPYAVENKTRKNSRGVDINRNFPHGWEYLADTSSPYYTGENPLSEKETVYIHDILSANKDAIALIDYHHYTGNETFTSFISGYAGTPLTSKIHDDNCYRMLAKWAKEYSFITPNTQIANTIISLNGSIGLQGVAYGIPISCTHENCKRLWVDVNGTEFDSNVMTMAYESFVNFLLQVAEKATLGFNWPPIPQSF